MKKLLAPLAVLVVLAPAASSLSAAPTSSVRLIATLNARQEVPKAKAPAAIGRFNATLDKTTGELTWRLTFRRLTGPALAAHIHLAKRGQVGAPVITLCGPCLSPESGTATASAAEKAALLKHGAYVNVHTIKHPGGEIRGQIVKRGNAK